MSLPLLSTPDRGFTSFVDAPVATDLASLEADVAIVGVPYGIPYEMGQSRSFSAPAHIREASLRFCGRMPAEEWERVSSICGVDPVRIVDCGDVPGDPMDLRGNVDRATEAIRAVLDRGVVPIVFGGDDAVPIPVVRAYEDHGPLTVVHIDQHADFGNEVRGVREGYCSPVRRMSEMPWVERIFQVALQGSCAGWGPGQGGAIVGEGGVHPGGTFWAYESPWAAGNTIVTAREVHEQGVGALLDRVPAGESYFVTMDFDGLDASACPAVSHPEPGGLTFWEAVDLLRGLAERGRVVGMDLVEMVPAHDLHGLGARTACRLVLNLIDAMARAGQFGGRAPGNGVS